MRNRKKQIPLAKKIVMITAAICALITGFWVGTQCQDMQKMAGYYVLAVTIITALQLLEKRNSHWEWGNILFLCVIYFVFGGVLIVLAEELVLYWCFVLWVVEAVVCMLLAIGEHNKKESKKNKRYQKAESL